MIKQLSFVFIAITILLIGVTPFSQLQQHSMHILPLGIISLGLFFLLLKQSFTSHSSSLSKQFLSFVAIFALVLFLSSHVVPSHMLFHPNAGTSANACVEHPCCVALSPVMLTTPPSCVTPFIGKMMVSTYTQKLTLYLQTDQNKSPPLTA